MQSSNRNSPARFALSLLLVLQLAMLTTSCTKTVTLLTPIAPISKQVVVQSPATDNYKVVTSGDLGLIGDGKYNNGSKLNEYMLHHRSTRIVLEKGDYVLDPVEVMTDSLSIDGNGSQITSNATQKSGNLILIQGKRIRLSQLVLDGSSGNQQRTGIEIHGTKDVELSGLTVRNFPAFGIDISNSDDVNVHNSTVSNTDTGIQFWGGDSQYHAGTQVNNLSISGNTVFNITTAGIWGSMGRNISMINNHVTKCGDVGLDLEGCDDSQIRNNVVSDCTNSCISLFFGCHRIAITSNQVKTGNDQYGVRLFTSKWNHSDIEIDSNSIQANYSMAFLIEERTASNVRIKYNTVSGESAQGLRSISNDSIQIVSNSFILSNCHHGIGNEGGSYWNIISNTLHNTPTSNPGDQSSGLFIYKSPQQRPIKNVASGNVITGFTVSVSDNTGS